MPLKRHQNSQEITPDAAKGSGRPDALGIDGGLGGAWAAIESTTTPREHPEGEYEQNWQEDDVSACSEVDRYGDQEPNKE
jgi:hypothetical protein